MTKYFSLPFYCLHYRNNIFSEKLFFAVYFKMNIKHHVDHHAEQNRQVSEHDKIVLHSPKNRRNQELESQGVTDENLILEARIQSLKETILSLKSELREEKVLWRKEVELMASLISGQERGMESDLNSDPDMEIKSVASIPVTSKDLAVSSPLIRDYEEKLNRYQGALAQAQAEKRFNIRRQIAANTYRKRLNEVEKLCQEELDKVRETATYLEPLKQLASEWSKPNLHYMEPLRSPTSDKIKRKLSSNVECGGDFVPVGKKEVSTQEVEPYEVPVKQIDASLVMDEDASNEIKGKIVLQIGSLPSEVPTICYSAKFE